MAEKIPAHTSHRDEVRPYDEFITADLVVVMGHDFSFRAAYEAMAGSGFDKNNRF